MSNIATSFDILLSSFNRFLYSFDDSKKLFSVSD